LFVGLLDCIEFKIDDVALFEEDDDPDEAEEFALLVIVELTKCDILIL
jgi:hypothetical protein